MSSYDFTITVGAAAAENLTARRGEELSVTLRLHDGAVPRTVDGEEIQFSWQPLGRQGIGQPRVMTLASNAQGVYVFTVDRREAYYFAYQQFNWDAVLVTAAGEPIVLATGVLTGTSGIGPVVDYAATSGGSSGTITGSDPDIDLGPYAVGTTSALTHVHDLSLDELAAIGLIDGTQATVAIRIQGETVTGAGVTRHVAGTISRSGGILSSISASPGADITACSTQEAAAGWSTQVSVSTDRARLELLGQSPESSSRWYISVWISSIRPLASAAEETPDITLTVPATAHEQAVPCVWMATPAVTGVYLNQTGVRPDGATAVSPPAVFSVAGEGDQVIYYWGHTATTWLSRKSVTSDVVLDITPPVISAFVLPGATQVSTVTITTLTSDDSGGTWYYNFSGTLPGAPTWGTKPTTISLPETPGTYTVYIWQRDAAGNISNPASDTILFSSDYLVDPFTTLSTDWVSSPGSVWNAVAGELVNTSGGWAWIKNEVAGTLPAEYYVTWNFPGLAWSWKEGFGFGVNWASDNSAAVIVISRFSVDSMRWFIGSGAPSSNQATLTWVQDNAVPGDWVYSNDLQVTVGITNNIPGNYAVYTLYLNGVQVSHANGPLAVAGRAVATVGDGTLADQRLYGVRVTPTLPSYP